MTLGFITVVVLVKIGRFPRLWSCVVPIRFKVHHKAQVLEVKITSIGDADRPSEEENLDDVRSFSRVNQIAQPKCDDKLESDIGSMW